MTRAPPLGPELLLQTGTAGPRAAGVVRGSGGGDRPPTTAPTEQSQHPRRARFIGTDLDATTNPGSSTAVSPSHQVADPSLHLKPRRPVVLLLGALRQWLPSAARVDAVSEWLAACAANNRQRASIPCSTVVPWSREMPRRLTAERLHLATKEVGRATRHSACRHRVARPGASNSAV